MKEGFMVDPIEPSVWRYKNELLADEYAYHVHKVVLFNNTVFFVDKTGQPCLTEHKFPLACCGATNEGTVRVCFDGKWGYADLYTGKIIVEPIYDYLGPLGSFGKANLGGNTEVAPMKSPYVTYTIRCRGGKYGHIDKQGKILVPILYDDACEGIESCGLGCVKTASGWGRVNEKNETTIPFRYRRPRSWNGNGWVRVQDGMVDWYADDFSLFISGADKVVKRGEYLLVQKGRKFGIVHKSGRWISDMTMRMRDARAWMFHLPATFASNWAEVGTSPYHKKKKHI